MKTSYLLILLLFIFLLGCAAKPTGYIKRDDYMGSQYGYNDKKINDDEYAIIAEGNRYSAPDYVAKLALYHAAKVTTRNGQTYFRILKKNDENLTTHEVATIIVPIAGAGMLYIPVAENAISEPTSILIIELCEDSGEAQTECINSKEIISELQIVFEKGKHN